jgi:hypothetical protein
MDYNKIFQDFYDAALKAAELTGDAYKQLSWFRRNKIMAKSKAHPGFKAVKSKIEKEGYSAKSAGAILASKTRGANKAAKKANPKLKKVKG